MQPELVPSAIRLGCLTSILYLLYTRMHYCTVKISLCKINSSPVELNFNYGYLKNNASEEKWPNGAQAAIGEQEAIPHTGYTLYTAKTMCPNSPEWRIYAYWATVSSARFAAARLDLRPMPRSELRPFLLPFRSPEVPLTPLVGRLAEDPVELVRNVLDKTPDPVTVALALSFGAVGAGVANVVSVCAGTSSPVSPSTVVPDTSVLLSSIISRLV